MEIIRILIPALVTLLGNLVFYLIIKQKIDKSLEKLKISYAGIFKEKVLIYKELLTKLYDIKKRINQYQFIGDNQMSKEIILSINDFISYYQANQPFLSPNMLKNLQIIRSEFQSSFDSLSIYYASNNSISDPDKLVDIFQSYLDATNKLRKSDVFNELENTIIQEMRKDLKVDEI